MSRQDIPWCRTSIRRKYFENENGEEEWKDMFRQLDTFREQHGTCNVIALSNNHKDLKKWLLRQQLLHLCKKLPASRKKLLSSIGLELPQEWSIEIDNLIASHCQQDKYKISTKLYKFFLGDGWLLGEIVSTTPVEIINNQESTCCVYKISYNIEAGSPLSTLEEEYDPLEYEELTQIVKQYNTHYLKKDVPALVDSKKRKADKKLGAKVQKKKMMMKMKKKSKIKKRYKIGTRVRKFFEGHGWFDGSITELLEDRYRVDYDDGDWEEYIFGEGNQEEQLETIVANKKMNAR